MHDAIPLALIARLRAQDDLALSPEEWPALAAQLAELLAGVRRLEELDLADVPPGPLWRADDGEGGWPLAMPGADAP